VTEHQPSFVSEALYEHRFWLTVLRDHMEFIKGGLAPKEAPLVEQATTFQREAVLRLQRVEELAGESEVRGFTMDTADFNSRLIQFKQMILDRQLACRIDINLHPSLIDHMVREAQEYAVVMQMLLRGERLKGAALAIHEANLWITDASGHAAVIRSNIDPQEQDIFDSAHHWKIQFDHLTIQLSELQTKLRSQVRWVPSLERLMELSGSNMAMFRQYLTHLEETLEQCRALGILKPLMMDHMAREATYFLDKLERAKETS